MHNPEFATAAGTPYKEIVAREFDTVTTNGEFKMRPLRPNRDTFNFAPADRIVDFAEAHGLRVRGHTLVWYDSDPAWVTNGSFSRDELITILHEHITTVVGRYRGRVAQWDVVNEAIEPDGSLRDSGWLRGIGPEYLEMAFRWTHEADPAAQLFYNDFAWYKPWQGLGWLGRVTQLVTDFRRCGVPIDGIGTQMHVSVTPGPIFQPPNYPNFRRVAEEAGRLGLQLHVTETDVQVWNTPGTQEEKLAAQARVYSQILRTALEYPALTQFETWGVYDGRTWIRGTFGIQDAQPLLFDTSFRPKPAYYAVKDALLTGPEHRRP
ncbi:MAG: endo-1,4-beta-xylanase [Actinomycetota bacterium]|nr:endo-1,4-beta-xylanase [Actinomycetota bacterium]